MSGRHQYQIDFNDLTSEFTQSNYKKEYESLDSLFLKIEKCDKILTKYFKDPAERIVDNETFEIQDHIKWEMIFNEFGEIDTNSWQIQNLIKYLSIHYEIPKRKSINQRI